MTDHRSPRPSSRPPSAIHHAAAAAGTPPSLTKRPRCFATCSAGTAPIDRLLLKAAAGAGKSYVLKRLVREAVAHDNCNRVAVVAFTNKQIHPLAADLGADARQGQGLPVRAARTGRRRARRRRPRTRPSPRATQRHPRSCSRHRRTCHKLGAIGELKRQRTALRPRRERQRAVRRAVRRRGVAGRRTTSSTRSRSAAPVWVGVGDVGQLPPIEIGTNPWRGDPGHNPWRAWPTDYDDDTRTWSAELPAVRRPAAGHLALWRAFYPDWHQLNCVAAPGDRSLGSTATSRRSPPRSGRRSRTGVPTLLEVDGLPRPRTPPTSTCRSSSSSSRCSTSCSPPGSR